MIWPEKPALYTVRNITIRFVRYSLRPLVFYLFNSLFVTDHMSTAGLINVYTVFPFKTTGAGRRFFTFLARFCSGSLNFVTIEPRLFLFISIRCSSRGQLFF